MVTFRQIADPGLWMAAPSGIATVLRGRLTLLTRAVYSLTGMLAAELQVKKEQTMLSLAIGMRLSAFCRVKMNTMSGVRIR